MPSLYREDMEIYSGFTKEQCLVAHLDSNFYPPIPSFIRQDTIEGFKAFWAGEIDTLELTEKCHLRDEDALFHFFNEYLCDDSEEE